MVVLVFRVRSRVSLSLGEHGSHTIAGRAQVSHSHWARAWWQMLCVDFGDVIYLCWPTGLEHLVQANLLPQLLRKLGVQLPVAAPGLFLKLSINEVLSCVSIHAHTRV